MVISFLLDNGSRSRRPSANSCRNHTAASRMPDRERVLEFRRINGLATCGFCDVIIGWAKSPALGPMPQGDLDRNGHLADRAVDAIRERFGRQAVGYCSVVLSSSRSVPDVFRELAERISSRKPTNWRAVSSACVLDQPRPTDKSYSSRSKPCRRTPTKRNIKNPGTTSIPSAICSRRCAPAGPRRRLRQIILRRHERTAAASAMILSCVRLDARIRD
jgi:hypothetical protein